MKTDNKKDTYGFPIVGIGASAGGLDAFKKLITAIPEDSGMAYIFVQHLSPDYPSNLTELLAPHSKIPVQEIISTIDLVPNHIYIVPENNNVIAKNGILQLQQRTRSDKRTNIIDVFFESLAKVHTTYAIGIILSGTAFDGSAGFKIIKEFGGATIAQDPKTAAFKGMPQSAIDADAVDFVLTPEEIPGKLLEIRKSYATNHAYTDEEHIPKNEEEILYLILNLVFLKTGNDFRQYKQPTLRRRIARRMVMVQRDSIEDYYNYLRNNPQEQELLFNDFLIPVTYFFRDGAFFDSLAETAFPLLLKNMTNNNIRIWIAGCATGEEAYSMAIVLHEYLSKTNRNVKVQIFASDISEKCIAKARAAIYSAQDVQQISEERLLHYFTKRDGHYHINKILRDMCVFATHNFITDPPFAKIDLVSCRNVMIYFNPYLQNKVLSSFHFSLKEKGLLLLGKSETTSNSQNLYESIGKNEKIYMRLQGPNRYIPESFSPSHPILKDKNKTIKTEIPVESDYKKIASNILLSQFTPSNVIIDKNLEIIHFHGDVRPFLTQPTGKPNFNILKLAPGNLSFELRHAIAQAKEKKMRIRKDDMHFSDLDYTISFEILALQNDFDHLMVVFHKKELYQTETETTTEIETADQRRIAELEQELSRMREDTKRISEEQQTAMEELQTTNEELLSSTEELQALNEELETAAEELNSNNEELMCVNDELLDRQQQLISARNYAESVIKTIREPLVIIDTDFMIKSANSSFYKYFNVSENETEGYSFFEIGNCQWDVPEFKEQISKQLANHSVIEDYKVDVICKGIGKKSMIVNARQIIDSKPEGMILLALEDITDLTATNTLLDAKKSELRKYNQQLEFFSSAGSHDLQEPLRKIQMFCKRFLDDQKNIDESGKYTIERIEALAANVRQLVDDLIEFSRINFVEKEFKKTDLNLVVKKTIQELKDPITEKKAVISVAPLPALNVIPNQLKQLFVNLILNSIKYAKEGIAPEIEIETSEPSPSEILEIGASEESSYVKICVIDNGVGFDTDYKERIFDPFYKLHNAADYHGSGLGLTFAKKIVENHFGYIRASSKINYGTKIYIYLPT